METSPGLTPRIPAPVPPVKSGDPWLDRLLNIVIAAAVIFVIAKAYTIVTRDDGPPVPLKPIFRTGQKYALQSSAQIRFRFEGSEKARNFLSAAHETDLAVSVEADASVVRADAEGILFDMTVSRYRMSGKAEKNAFDVDTSRPSLLPTAGMESLTHESTARSYIKSRRSVRMRLEPGGGVSFPGDSFISHPPVLMVISVPNHALITGTAWEESTDLVMPGLGGRLGQVKAASYFSGWDRVDGRRCARIDQEFLDDRKNPQLIGKGTLWLESGRGGMIKNTIRGSFRYSEDVFTGEGYERAVIVVEVTGETVMRKIAEGAHGRR